MFFVLSDEPSPDPPLWLIDNPTLPTRQAPPDFVAETMLTQRAAVAAPRARATLSARASSARSARRAASLRVDAASSIYDFTLKRLGGGTRDAPTEGADLPLSQYKGKVVLINNVATM